MWHTKVKILKQVLDHWMHSKRGNEVAFSSHYKSLKVELPEVDLSSKTKCLWSLETKKLGFHPTQVASTGVKQESSSLSQSWSKSSKSPRSQSFDRPIMKSTHKRWGGNAPCSQEFQTYEVRVKQSDGDIDSGLKYQHSTLKYSNSKPPLHLVHHFVLEPK